MSDRHLKRAPSAVAALVLSGILACGEGTEGPAAPSVIRADSAGTEIVSVAVDVRSGPRVCGARPRPENASWIPSWIT